MVSLLVAALFILPSGCKKKASPEEVKAAAKVVERYNEAWLNQDMETMYNLSTKERIRSLTDVDPDKGSAHLELAKKRFNLIAEQTRVFLGYEQLEIEEVVKSQPGRVVFKIKALHKKGSRVEKSSFIRELVKKKEGWRLN